MNSSNGGREAGFARKTADLTSLLSMTVSLLAVVAVAAVIVLALAWRLLRRGARAPGAVIAESRSLTSLDDATGAVRSVQTAVVTLPADALATIWSPEYLERLARTYWRFLSRVTLGLIQVRYSEHERSIVLLFGALKLLTFQAPEYEMDRVHGLVRWRIARGRARRQARPRRRRLPADRGSPRSRARTTRRRTCT